ncbi:uncharacterized protein [Rutidosis leptorrhynchoides]|uniref:uncharacterized protein n=1 Tax=Rutidosis leptorrhynchoides TaxID=125765 RepID=UPI003A990D6C
MRQPGQYVDSGGNNAYGAAAQMQRVPGQRMEHKSNNYQQGRADHHVNVENEKSYGGVKGEGQWRWERERDGSSHMFNQGQGADASRSYYQSQGQRSDPRSISEKQVNDIRSQPREADMEIGYDDNVAAQTYEGLEQRFYDEILKLSKELNDAEDAENARHRERVNTINAQYEEQLAALRARHTNRRDEFLKRESQARQQQYQQALMEQQQQYASIAMGPGDPHVYGGAESQRAYNTPHVDSYRDRPRFGGGNRDPAVEPRGQYPGGRAYGSGSRYY